MLQHPLSTVQELMETITSSESLPRRLTSAQRKRRLEEERRLPEEAVKRAERAIRRGLWNTHLDNVRMMTMKQLVAAWINNALFYI